jgi:GAF domain-containing protein
MKTKTLRIAILLLMLLYIGSVLYASYSLLFGNTEPTVEQLKKAGGNTDAIRTLVKAQNQTALTYLGLETVLALVIFILLAQANRTQGDTKVVYVEKYVGRDSDKATATESGREAELLRRAGELSKQWLAQATLGEAIGVSLRQCCTDLGAVVGAYYAVKRAEGQVVAELAGGYALPDTMATRFYPGEGAGGQVLQDGREQLLAHVPADYLVAGSGLGKAQPGHLAVVPVLGEGLVKGVLEIGTFHPLDAPSLAYLRQFATMLGQY